MTTAYTGAILLAAVIITGIVIGTTRHDQLMNERYDACFDAGNTAAECRTALGM